jgi:hypothetical protein
MSVTTTSSVPTKPPVVELVRSLPPAEKEALLVTLLRELIARNSDGTCLIPIHTGDGESLGYYVPPRAAAAQAESELPKLDPEERAELTRRRMNPGPTITTQEWVSELRAKADGAGTQTP